MHLASFLLCPSCGKWVRWGRAGRKSPRFSIRSTSNLINWCRCCGDNFNMNHGSSLSWPYTRFAFLSFPFQEGALNWLIVLYFTSHLNSFPALLCRIRLICLRGCGAFTRFMTRCPSVWFTTGCVKVVQAGGNLSSQVAWTTPPILSV